MKVRVVAVIAAKRTEERERERERQKSKVEEVKRGRETLILEMVHFATL